MSLELIVGCMYSGKSSELMRRVHRLRTYTKPKLTFNPP